MKFILSVMPEQLAICRLEPGASYPDWIRGGGLVSITQTSDELSIICQEQLVPQGILADTGWRALKVQGPLDFSLVGVLAGLSGLLAAAGVSIFAISTFDTDYILVKEGKRLSAISALREAGHQILESPIIN
jgi:uncharacterized protein